MVNSMNYQDEQYKILESVLGKVDFKQVSSLLLDQTDLQGLTYKFKNSLRSNIDLIITFTQDKITDKKYLNLLLALGESCSIHGETNIAREIFNKVLSISKNEKAFLNIRGYANLQIAIIESNQASWNAAKRCLRNAVKIFYETNDEVGLAECENLLGTTEAEKGKLELAKIHFENAYSNVKYRRKSLTKSKIEVNLGIVYNMLENYMNAEMYFRKALASFEEENELKRIVETRHNLGMMYLKMGKHDLAIKEFKSSLKISEVENFLPILGITHLSLSETYLLMGNMEKAVSSADSSLEISNKINDRLTIADIYKIKGIIYIKNKNYTVAESYLLTSLRINTELKNELNSAETNFELGLLYRKVDKKSNAEKHFNLAMKYYTKYSCQNEIAKISKHLQQN